MCSVFIYRMMTALQHGQWGQRLKITRGKPATPRAPTSRTRTAPIRRYHIRKRSLRVFVKPRFPGRGHRSTAATAARGSLHSAQPRRRAAEARGTPQRCVTRSGRPAPQCGRAAWGARRPAPFCSASESASLPKRSSMSAMVARAPAATPPAPLRDANTERRDYGAWRGAGG